MGTGQSSSSLLTTINESAVDHPVINTGSNDLGSARTPLIQDSLCLTLPQDSYIAHPLISTFMRWVGLSFGYLLTTCITNNHLQTWLEINRTGCILSSGQAMRVVARKACTVPTIPTNVKLYADLSTALLHDDGQNLRVVRR